MSSGSRAASLFDPALLKPAIVDSFRKLDPRVQIRNPVMFTLEIVALVATVLMIRDIATSAKGIGFTVQIVLWLWLTLLFANSLEAFPRCSWLERRRMRMAFRHYRKFAIPSVQESLERFDVRWWEIWK